jgi:hypothetical protein
VKVYLRVGDSTAELGSDGITFTVWDKKGQERIGRLRIGKATVEWCAKNGKMGYGKKINLEHLIEMLEQD